jgi:hypothetical protein
VEFNLYAVKSKTLWCRDSCITFQQAESLRDEVVRFQVDKGRATMTTPTNDTPNNPGDQKEPKDKGGVVGTDAKKFDEVEPFEKSPKREPEAPANSETK